MKNVTLFPSQNIPDVKDQLWRYFDLHKLIDLLYRKQFRFSRMDTFEDPLEGVPLRAWFTYKTKLDPELIQGLSLSELILVEQFRDLVPESMKKKLNTIRAIQTSTFVTCWFAEQRESLAMWNLYSNVDGVAVKIPFGELVSNLTIQDEGISAYYGGMVEYIELRNLYSSAGVSALERKKVALRKDSSFKHECEFRFVIRVRDHRNELKGINSDSIDLKKIGMKVVCHPRMAAWKKKNIERMLDEHGLTDAYEESIIMLR